MVVLWSGVYACAYGEWLHEGSIFWWDIAVIRVDGSSERSSSSECGTSPCWRKPSQRRIGSEASGICAVIGKWFRDIYQNTADECGILLWIFPDEDSEENAIDELCYYCSVSVDEYIGCVYVPMSELTIYTTSPKLAEILKMIPALSGFRHNVLMSKAGLDTADTNTVIITSHVPADFAPDAKYILCTNSPELLPSSVLEKLYDLWPLPLTPALIRYLFSVVQTRIKYETENNAEHSEHQKRILEMARQDYLTGLATRWYLQDFIERNRHERNITCIYLDLDNFKAVNDTYGHQAGDRALAATAEMMQNEFPDGFAARMGGDEFMIVLLGRRDIQAVSERVNGFMTRLLKYYATTRTMQKLSVSAGISQSRPDAEKSIDQIIHEADRALYEAKKSGKAMCKVYSEKMG